MNDLPELQFEDMKPGDTIVFELDGKYVTARCEESDTFHAVTDAGGFVAKKGFRIIKVSDEPPDPASFTGVIND